MINSNDTGIVTDASLVRGTAHATGNSRSGYYIPQQQSVRYGQAQMQQSPLHQRRTSHTLMPAPVGNRLTTAHLDQITDIFQELLISDTCLLTTTHLDQIADIFQELSISDTYLLAVQLGLPDDNRLELLSGGAAGDDVHDSLLEQLRTIAPNSKLNLQQLLVALTRSGRLDLAHICSHRFEIEFNDYEFERILSCEDPSPEPHGLDHNLSLIDLCQIFSGKLDDLSATPVQTLAQATGFRNLLANPELRRLIEFDIRNADKKVAQPSPNSGGKTNDQLSTYWLLEKILQYRGGMTAGEVAATLCIPEIGQFNIARRLIWAVTNLQTKEMSIQLKVQLLHEAPETFKLISGLVDYKVPLDPEDFACALGVPAYIIALLRPLKPDTATLMNIIFQARKRHDYLHPGHILYALQRAVAPDDIRRLNVAYMKINVPLFRSYVVTKPPPFILPVEADESPAQTPDSVPLTSTFLSTLPLSHNWILIGLAMGLDRAELQQIHDKSDSDTRLLAFYLSEKLIEPHRQLETNDLYRALVRLGDQEALKYFSTSRSGRRTRPMPGPMKRELNRGMQIAIQLLENYERYQTPIDKYLNPEEWIQGIHY